MGPAKRASPSSIQPKEHTRGGIQTDPCLTIGTFPELSPWALDIEKKTETKTRPSPTLWFVMVSAQQPTTKFLNATLD